MHCDEALQHLNARTDGELSVRQAEQLAHHLAECPSCRTAAAGLPALDADLRHVFASRRAAAARLAERTIAAVRLAGDLPAPQAKPFTPARSFAWAQALLALAAGFLLAIVIFRPWQSPQAPPAAVAMRPPIARLAVASAP
ncbi:MAG: zf-HC2 domain-containing protein, partial [Planctomycetaceae bacterium]|nr:zf-HC2 domain-containing protein [Planctomycetaceae bacterium]